MPRLLTRISASPARLMKVSTPSAVPRSAAMASTFACGNVCVSRFLAASADCSLRPLRTTAAPASASPRAMAKPIPAVEPVTMARFPSSSICMGQLRNVTDRDLFPRCSAAIARGAGRPCTRALVGARAARAAGRPHKIAVSARRVGLANPFLPLVTVNVPSVLRRHLDPERRPVVGGRRRCVRARRRSRDRSDRHRRRRLVGRGWR